LEGSPAGTTRNSQVAAAGTLQGFRKTLPIGQLVFEELFSLGKSSNPWSVPARDTLLPIRTSGGETLQGCLFHKGDGWDMPILIFGADGSLLNLKHTSETIIEHRGDISHFFEKNESLTQP
jgi:hypothetical protein